MSAMRQSIAIPFHWLVGAFVGTLGGVIVGGIWFGRRVSEEWYLQGLMAGRSEAKEKKKEKRAKKEGEDSSSSEEESDSEDEAVPVERQELDPFTDRNEECKLVLVVRTDLKMGQGSFLPQISESCMTEIDNSQARLLRSAAMLLSLATRPSSARLPIHPSSAAGKDMAR